MPSALQCIAGHLGESGLRDYTEMISMVSRPHRPDLSMFSQKRVTGILPELGNIYSSAYDFDRLLSKSLCEQSK